MARHRFSFGLLQASISKADIRDLLTGKPTPEAPRTIIDVLATVDRLPFHMQARSEFEYVGQKPLSDGFSSGPVKEFRAAVVRSLMGQRMQIGVNLLFVSGYKARRRSCSRCRAKPRPSSAWSAFRTVLRGCLHLVSL